jgi:Holliday junction resolvasome RuvABC endonuclease subunit
MFDGETWDTTTVKTKTLGPAHGDFIDRMDEIAGKVISWCDPHEGDVVALEGPALAAKSRALDRMFGGWWMLYRALREHGAEPFVVTTGTLKKLATGSGSAGKDQMLLAGARRLQAAPIESNDEADAAWLTVAAARIDGHEIVKLPKLHTDGLDDLIRGMRKATP